MRPPGYSDHPPNFKATTPLPASRALLQESETRMHAVITLVYQVSNLCVEMSGMDEVMFVYIYLFLYISVDDSTN